MGKKTVNVDLGTLLDKISALQLTTTEKDMANIQNTILRTKS